MLTNLTQAPLNHAAKRENQKSNANPFQDLVTGRDLLSQFIRQFDESRLKPAQHIPTRYNIVRLNTGVRSWPKRGGSSQQFSIELNLANNQYTLYLGDQPIPDAKLETNAPKVIKALTRRTEQLKEENKLGETGLSSIINKVKKGELFEDAKIISIGNNVDGGKQITLKVTRSAQTVNKVVNLTGTISIDTDKQGRPQVFAVEIGVNGNKPQEYRKVAGTQITNAPGGQRITDPNIQTLLQKQLSALSL